MSEPITPAIEHRPERWWYWLTPGGYWKSNTYDEAAPASCRLVGVAWTFQPVPKVWEIRRRLLAAVGLSEPKP